MTTTDRARRIERLRHEVAELYERARTDPAGGDWTLHLAEHLAARLAYLERDTLP